MPLFLFSTFKSSGNKTSGRRPIQQMIREENNQLNLHQVKRSNSFRRLRKWIGYDPDSADVIGEFIASTIAHLDFKSICTKIFSVH